MKAARFKDKVWLEDGYNVEHEYHVYYYLCPAEPDIGFDESYIEIDDITNSFGESINVSRERRLEILEAIEMRIGPHG